MLEDGGTGAVEELPVRGVRQRAVHDRARHVLIQTPAAVEVERPGHVELACDIEHLGVRVRLDDLDLLARADDLPA